MTFHGKILDRGRIVIPVQLRRSLDLQPGEDIVLREHKGAIVIVRLKQIVKQIQDLASSRIDDETSLVDELLTMRQNEVQKEEVELSNKRDS